MAMEMTRARAHAGRKSQAHAGSHTGVNSKAINRAEREFTGVLAGWKTQSFDGRMIVHLQTVTTSPPHEPEDITDLYVLIDPAQAVQLGQNLFAMAEASVPQPPRRGWLERMFAP